MLFKLMNAGPCCRSHVYLYAFTMRNRCAYPPRSPNSLAQSSNSFRPCLLTLGLMFIRLALKSSIEIGLMSSGAMCRSFSPRLRSGPIAASLARAVISEPEKPVPRVSGCTFARKTRWKHTVGELDQFFKVGVAHVMLLCAHKPPHLRLAHVVLW